jgi:hypothetical protein
LFIELLIIEWIFVVFEKCCLTKEKPRNNPRLSQDHETQISETHEIHLRILVEQTIYCD